MVAVDKEHQRVADRLKIGASLIPPFPPPPFVVKRHVGVT